MNQLIVFVAVLATLLHLHTFRMYNVELIFWMVVLKLVPCNTKLTPSWLSFFSILKYDLFI